MSLSARKLSAVLAVALLGVTSSTANAASKSATHKHTTRIGKIAHSFFYVNMPEEGEVPEEIGDLPNDAKTYSLKLAHAHTNEAIEVIYRVGDTYIPEALTKLNNFLHDTHNLEVSKFDPRTFDVLHTMLAKVGKAGSSIDILSAYRSKETNDALRRSGTTNAAEHSQHIEAKAIDIRVDGVPAATLRDAALSLEAGGVGYYPKAQFIHVDVGPVRKWTYTHHASKKRGHRAKSSKKRS